MLLHEGAKGTTTGEPAQDHLNIITTIAGAGKSD
jgi:hypothetical protein